MGKGVSRIYGNKYTNLRGVGSAKTGLGKVRQKKRTGTKKVTKT